jgi:hypothetical protein
MTGRNLPPPFPWRALENWLVVLIVLHSAAVGFFLLFFTGWGTRFGGWPDVHPLFFARQAGIFHFVVGAAYLIEWFRYRGVAVLVTAKCLAVVFLLGMFAVDGGPWPLPLSALGDGAMALVVVAVDRKRLSSEG